MLSLKRVVCTILLASLAAAFPMEGASLAKRQTTECAPVHILVARGSLEPAGNGQLDSLVQRVLQNGDATSEAIDYPAWLLPYGPSVAAGTEAVLSQLAAHVEACPDSKVVLIGYSQGAQVIGDALCGGDAAGDGSVTGPMDTELSSHVAAVVWYGDPRHVAGSSFDKGTATTDGEYVRPEGQSCEGFSDRIASYCDAGDSYCAEGLVHLVHFTYPQRYDDAAAAFVEKKVGSKDG